MLYKNMIISFLITAVDVDWQVPWRTMCEYFLQRILSALYYVPFVLKTIFDSMNLIVHCQNHDGVYIKKDSPSFLQENLCFFSDAILHSTCIIL